MLRNDEAGIIYKKSDYLLNSFNQKLYIILEGKVGVYTKIKENADANEPQDQMDFMMSGDKYNKKNKKLIQCIREQESGQAFGDLDLSDDKPRAETIICHSDCWCAVLNKREFQTIIRQYEEDKLLKEMGFFALLPLFQGWYFIRIREIYQSAVQMNFKKESIVYKEGAPSKYVYVIASGEFVAKMKFNQAAQQNELPETEEQISYKNEYKQKKSLKLTVLSHPDIFGEEDILKQQNRSYSVVCESSSGSLIAIDKDDFLNKIMTDSHSSQFIKQRLESRTTNITNRINNIENLLSQYSSFVIDEKNQKSKEKDRDSFSQQVNSNQRRSTFLTYTQYSHSNSFFIQENKKNEVVSTRQISPQRDRQSDIILEEQKEVILPKNEYFLQEIQQFNQLGYNESFEEENPMNPTSPIRDSRRKRTINIIQLQRPGSIRLVDDNSDNGIESVSPICPPHRSQSQYNMSQSSQSFINPIPLSSQNSINVPQEKYVYRLKENYQSSLQQHLEIEKALQKQSEILSPKKLKIKEEIRKDPLSDGFKKQLQIRFFNQFKETNLKSLQEHIPQQIVQDTPKNINQLSLSQFKTDLLKNSKIVIPYAGKSGVRNYLRDMQNKVDKKLKKESENTPLKNKDHENENIEGSPQRSKSVFFDRNSKGDATNQSNTNVLLSKIINHHLIEKPQKRLERLRPQVLTNPPSRSDSLADTFHKPTQNIISTPVSITQINSRKNSLNDSSAQKQVNISTLQEFKIRRLDTSPLKVGQNRNVFKNIQTSSIKNRSPMVQPIHSNIQQIQKLNISPMSHRFKSSDLLPLTKNTVFSKINLLQEYYSINQSTQQPVFIKNVYNTNASNNTSILNTQNLQSNANLYSVQSFTDCVDDLNVLNNKSSKSISKISTLNNILDNTTSPSKVSPNLSPSKRKNIQRTPTYKFQIHQQDLQNSKNKMELTNTLSEIENNFIVRSTHSKLQTQTSQNFNKQKV